MDEKTKVPISWLFAFFSISGSALILGITVAVWLSRVEAKAYENERSIVDSKISESKTIDYLRSIDQRLSRIEGAVGVKR